MTQAQAGALHWQEMAIFIQWALRADNESDRQHYLAMAQDANRDRMMAEQTTTQKGRTE